MSLRIGFVHNPSRRGALTGEDIAASQQRDALLMRGHGVADLAFTMRSRLSASALRPVLLGRNPMYRAQIRDSDAAVLHFHKWFPWFGREDFRTLRRPTVMTLHNFRPLCPAGTLFRDGQLCTRCVERMPISAVGGGCYRGSRLETLPVAVGQRGPGRRHPALRFISRFVAPSRRAAEIFMQYAGLDEERVAVLPSFVPTVDFIRSDRVNGWLFVGQLEETKGIRRLVATWPRNQSLTIIGDGSQREEVSSLAQGKDIRIIGRQGPSVVRAAMDSHTGLLFPSSYLETQGLVVGEAASVGCPVVALAGTAGADQVSKHGFGVVCDDILEMHDRLTTVRRNRDVLSVRGVSYWREYLTVDRWLEGIEGIYRPLVQAG